MSGGKRAAVPAARIASPSRSVLQRACGCTGGGRHAGKCEDCSSKQVKLQRQAQAHGASSQAPPVVDEALRMPGRALDGATRAVMEARMGHDFGRVRVHADAKAAESARAVHALAYTVGHDVVFAANQYAPHSQAGQRLLAHELAHVVQQRGAPHVPAAKLEVGTANDPAEREADRIAGEVSGGKILAKLPAAAPAALRRWVTVEPAGAAAEVLGQFNTMCAGKFSSIAKEKWAQITADCSPKDKTKNKSCECLCDVTHDTKRWYRIKVAKLTVSEGEEEVTGSGGSRKKEKVPQASDYPNTLVNDNPVITLAGAGSAAEFGHFDPSGKAVWYDAWRIMAHELCGHGRLKQLGNDKDALGCRPSHDATITTENEIAAEHGGSARGKRADKRQGESFYNPTGKRGKIRFGQCDGLHFEAP